MESKFLLFRLGDQKYALDLSKVKSIESVFSIVPIPVGTPFIKGIINLRGSVVAIYNLHKHLDIPASGKLDSIIISETHGIQIGLGVDYVEGIVTVDDTDVNPIPIICRNEETAYLGSVVKLGEDEIVLSVDVDRIMTEEDFETVSKALDDALNPEKIEEEIEESEENIAAIEEEMNEQVALDEEEESEEPENEESEEEIAEEDAEVSEDEEVVESEEDIEESEEEEIDEAEESTEDDDASDDEEIEDSEETDETVEESEENIDESDDEEIEESEDVEEAEESEEEIEESVDEESEADSNDEEDFEFVEEPEDSKDDAEEETND